MQPRDYEILKEIAERAHGTKMCQLCHASYTKKQPHDEDCPIGKYERMDFIPAIQQSTVRPKVLEFEALASNGLRIIWNGTRNCSIEGKDGDEWKPLKYVRNITISFGVEDQIPVVKMEYYIIKDGRETMYPTPA